MTNNITRKNNFDNLKGVLIFLVVLGHLLYSFTQVNTLKATQIVYFIFTFHMPLFMIVSGYFSKKKTNKTKLLKLIIMFLLLNLSYTIYDFVITHNFSLLVLKHSSWYLLLLIIYKFLYDLKLREIVDKHKKMTLILSLISAITIGFFKCGLFISRFFEYTLFFNLGYLLNYYKSLKNKKISYLLFIFSIILLAFLVKKVPADMMFYLGDSYSNYSLAIYRFIMYLTDILLYLSIINIMPNIKIPFISHWGKNSLYIYILHRIPTLIITNYFINKPHFIKLMFILAFILCIVLSYKYIVKVIEFIINFMVNSLKKMPFITSIVLIILFVSLLLIDLQTNHKINILSKKISVKKQEKINNSISIGFLGDLLLLEDQVKDSYENGKYNFDYMFDYTKSYIQDTDYTIGVFEGPSDDNQEYSVGNFVDGKEMHLNYPSEFIKSIKNAGIDLVTTSNNHIYDRGYEGAIQTINNLNKFNLDYVGTYTKDNMSGKYKIINIKGIKVGIVAYTFFTNYEQGEGNDDVVDRLYNIDNPNFQSNKEAVTNDIKNLKSKDVDLIIVLPHYGTQFKLDFDDFQKTWNDIFLEAGADIIFGDHSHAVGPIKYSNNSLVLGSPGNYVNSYIGRDGDLSMYVKVYIDKKTKKIITTSAIPMLAMKKDKSYFPVPLYDIDEIGISGDVTTNVLKLFGKTVIHDENIKLSKEYYINKYSYNYPNRYILKLTKKDKRSTIYQEISKNNKICFIGDSITEGLENDFHPWYEPLMRQFKNKKIINISKGGYTTNDILNNYSDKIKKSNCELSIINIGTNDIRYGALDVGIYKENIEKILKLLDENSTKILLTPWLTYAGDKFIGDNVEYKKSLYNVYSNTLRELAKNNDSIYFINPNDYIKEAIEYNGQKTYIIDGVHPNNNAGIKLYSFATMRS